MTPVGWGFAAGGLILWLFGMAMVGAATFGNGAQDVGGWLEAIATLAALVAAAVAAGFAAKALRYEANREKRYDVSQIRGQAELVAAWYDRKGLRFSNRSQLPVYDLRVTLGLDAGKIVDEVPFGALGPTSEPVDLRLHAEAYEEHSQWVDWAIDAEPPVDDPTVEIRFRDSAGNYWVRGPDGKLSGPDQASD